MYVSANRHRDMINIYTVTVITIAFALFSITIHFFEKVYDLLTGMFSLVMTEFFINFSFLYLAALLLLTFRRWRKSTEREEELDDVISSISPDALVVVDSERNITMANASLERMFGYETGEMLGKKIDALLGETMEAGSQKDEIRDALEKEGYRIQLSTGRKKNGDIIPLEIITGTLHKKKGAVQLICDISERSRIEKGIRESEERFRNIFQNAAEGIFLSTPDGNLECVNPSFAHMIGFKPPEQTLSPERNVTIQQYFVNPEEYKKYLAQMEKSGFVHGMEARVYGKNRGIMWVSMNVHTVHDTRGVHYEGIMENVTHRKESEEALKENLARTKKALRSTVGALITAGELRDPFTAGHQKRMAGLAKEIARVLGLTEETIEGIYIMGLLHDVGKITVPADILIKPSRLNEREMNIIKTHAKAGYDIVREIEFPWPVHNAILQHHERLNGSGYPSGILGEDIMLEARILAVADVVEAMASHRPYRPAYGIEDVLSEITANKDRLYDAETVDACIYLFKKEDFRFEEYRL